MLVPGKYDDQKPGIIQYMASLRFAFSLTVLLVSLCLTPLLASPGSLIPEFHDFSCPQANEIVMSVLEKAIAEDPRIAASLLRLHFHDCFVQVLAFCLVLLFIDLYLRTASCVCTGL